MTSDDPASNLKKVGFRLTSRDDVADGSLRKWSFTTASFLETPAIKPMRHWNVVNTAMVGLAKMFGEPRTGSGQGATTIQEGSGAVL